MFRKIHIAVNCDNDEEYRAVQKIAEEMSSVMRLTAQELIAVYPEIKKRYGMIATAKSAIKEKGKKGLMAVVGQILKSI